MNARAIVLPGMVSILLLATPARAQNGTVTPHAVRTDNPRNGKVDDAVHFAAEKYMANPRTVDLSIGVWKEGKAYRYNYHRGEGALPTATSFYGIGSIAQTFVTTLLAQAVVEGKVKLSDDIRKYLPGKYPNLAYNGKPVHLRDLANHTSGLPELSQNYSPRYFDSLSRFTPRAMEKWYNTYTSDSLLRDMRNPHYFVPDTVPGTRYRYNGNAILVLAVVLEKVYNKPYAALIKDYVKAHFGMTETRIELTPAEKKRLLQGHDESGEPLPYVCDKGFRAAPNLMSTINDMLKYVQAGALEKDPVIKLTHKSTWNDTIGGSNIGLGWMLGTDDHGPYSIHTGHDGTGYNSLCVLYPKQQTGIVILVNESTGQDRVAEMKEVLVRALFTR